MAELLLERHPRSLLDFLKPSPSAQLIMTSYFIFWTSIHSFSLVIIKLIGVVDSNIMYFDKVGL